MLGPVDPQRLNDLVAVAIAETSIPDPTSKFFTGVEYRPGMLGVTSQLERLPVRDLVTTEDIAEAKSRTLFYREIPLTDYDETRVSISVVKNGEPVPVFQGSRLGYESNSVKKVTHTEFYDFILTNVSEGQVEKSQIATTFGDDWVFFFGKQPLVLQCQGILPNTASHPWLAEFIQNYENFFRGSKLLELDAKCHLRIENDVFEGYMMNFVYQKSADIDRRVPFSFAFYVSKITRSIETQLEEGAPVKYEISGDVAEKMLAAANAAPDKRLTQKRVGDALLKVAWDGFLDPKKIIKAARTGDWGGYLSGAMTGIGMTGGGFIPIGKFSASEIYSKVLTMHAGGVPEITGFASSLAGSFGLSSGGFRDRFAQAVWDGKATRETFIDTSPLGSLGK